jgi:hypothetical protein
VTEQTQSNLVSLRRFLQRMVDDEKDLPQGRGAEKRRHSRHLYMSECHVKYVKRFAAVSSCPDEFTTMTKDLSRSGMGFIHEHQMFVGEAVQVNLAVKGQDKTFLVRITRCKRAGLRIFEVAGEFITPAELAGATPEPGAKEEDGKPVG